MLLAGVQLRQGNGCVWHTTGSGKTLTSFKAAQNRVELPKVDEAVFIVDRVGPDDQAAKEFNHFEPGSADGTDNTRQSVRQSTDPTKRLVVTTIQKLHTAISRDRWALELKGIGAGHGCSSSMNAIAASSTKRTARSWTSSRKHSLSASSARRSS